MRTKKQPLNYDLPRLEFAQQALAAAKGNNGSLVTYCRNWANHQRDERDEAANPGRWDADYVGVREACGVPRGEGPLPLASDGRIAALEGRMDGVDEKLDRLLKYLGESE